VAQLRIDENAPLWNVMLSDKAEEQRAVRVNRTVAILQRRNAVGLVPAYTALGAKPEVETVDKSHNQREHTLLSETLPAEVVVDPPSQSRQQCAEPLNLLVL